MRDLVNTAEEFSSLTQSNRHDFVRGYEDFDRSFTEPLRDLLYAPEDGRSAPHPLAHLDREVIKAFRDGLVFKDGGLAHADYSMLVDKLSYRQFSQLWALFGLSMRYFADYQDMKCKSPGTCVNAYFNICLSSC